MYATSLNNVILNKLLRSNKMLQLNNPIDRQRWIIRNIELRILRAARANQNHDLGVHIKNLFDQLDIAKQRLSEYTALLEDRSFECDC